MPSRPLQRSFPATLLGLALLLCAAPLFAQAPLLPTDDASVSSTGTVNGSDPQLLVQYSSTVVANRQETYVQFNLMGVPSKIHSARLRLFGLNRGASTSPVQVVALSTEDLYGWSESTLTYGSRPPFNLELDRQIVSSGTATWYEWDVTACLRRAARRHQPFVTILLRSNIDSTGAAVFSSKEAMGNKPQLVIAEAKALVVRGPETETDRVISQRLTALGYVVRTVDATTATAADANGQAVVVLTPAVAPTAIGNRFTTVPVPVVTTNYRSFGVMKLANSYGRSTTSHDLHTGSGSPLLGGLTGTVRVIFSMAFGVGWGTPSPYALRVADDGESLMRQTVFGYERGTRMAGLDTVTGLPMTAPARRVGLFMDPLTFPTSEGWQIFDASVTWAANARPMITKKTLVLNFDPILRNHGNIRLSQKYASKFKNPMIVTDQYHDAISQASHDYVQWETNFVTIDAWPERRCDEQITEDEFVLAYDHYIATGSDALFPPSQTGIPQFLDYHAIIDEFDLNTRAYVGELDEVILWLPPFSGAYETRMVGPTALYTNSPGLYQPSYRNYVITVLNPDASLGNALEAFAHRAESIMEWVYRNHTNRGEWGAFTRYDDVPTDAACGTVHYAPTTRKVVPMPDRDWAPTEAGAPRRIFSVADDWMYNHPYLTGERREIDYTDWGPVDASGLGYKKWWLSHLPHKPSRRFELNNWWEYILNWDKYPESTGETAGTECCCPS